MNILLLSMSSFPGRVTTDGSSGNQIYNLRENVFIYGDGNEEKTYYSQLEPITRMLIEKGKQPDEIIILCTNESIKSSHIVCDGEEYYLSPCDFYKQRINLFKSKDSDIIFTKIPQEGVLDPDSPESKREAVAEVAAYLLQKKKENDELHVWIDTQGGMRDISLLMNAVVSLLKTRNITIEDIYSINYSNGAGKIMKQNDTYHIFEFVSGMNEFIEYGRTDQLINYYKNMAEKELPDIINVMQNLSNAILLCDPDEFDTQLKELRKQINNYKENENDVLFSVFIEQIREDYDNLLKPSCTALDVIEWMSSKKMYQQTLTYLESKIPTEWKRRNILKFGEVSGIDENHKSEFLITEINAYTNLLYKKNDAKDKIREIKNRNDSFDEVVRLVDESKHYYNYSWARVDRCKKCRIHVTYKNTKYENIYVETSVNPKDRDKLYKQILMYKILKEERNIWCHMLKDKHMKLADLNKLIEMFVSNGRELYNSIK